MLQACVKSHLLCRSVDVQDAQQQRLCTQEASILQMKQELLRASIVKDEINNQNVRHSLPEEFYCD